MTAKTNNVVNETEAQRKARLDALNKTLRGLEDSLKTAKTDEDKAELSEQIESVKDEINPFRHSLSAGVTEGFSEAVRQAARKEGWTVQTFLRYHVERAVGKNPTKPPQEVGEAFSLGVGVDRATKDAIRDALPDDGSMSQFLREVAAEGAGYDLSLEPEKVAPGEAMRKFQAKAKTQDTLLLALWSEPANRDMVRRICADKGISLADAGIVE